MNPSCSHNSHGATLRVACGVRALHLSTAQSSPVTLFSETFEGYTIFPAENPMGYNPPGHGENGDCHNF